MVFHTPQKRVKYPTLTLNNANIERVSQFNFLVVVLASTLKGDKHIAHVSVKVSRTIGINQIKAYSIRGVTNSV